MVWMSPKVPGIKDLVPTPWHYWETVGTFKRWSLVGGSSSHLGCALEGDVRILAPSSSFLSTS